MKITFITLAILIGCGNISYAKCSGSAECYWLAQYNLADNINSGVISGIQSKFGGRVVSTQNMGNGAIQIQLIRPDNKVVIIIVDATGNIISIRE